MVWKPASSPKCRVCNKSVFHVEQVIGPGGHIYHEQCFKCSTCKKKLDSTLLTERDHEIYCKTCYGKNFGPKGYGFAGGSSFLTTGMYALNDGANRSVLESDTSSIDSSPVINTPKDNLNTSSKLLSPREVPPIPTLSSKKDEYLSQIQAGNAENSRSVSPKPNSGSIYMPNPKRFTVKADLCGKCHKSVYLNESVNVLGKKLHQSCCKCTKCNKQLNSINMTEHTNELFCKQCYSKEFGPKGYGYANGSAFLTSNGAI